MDPRIAIVGMEAIFPAAESLDAFDRAIFDGVRLAKGPAEDPGGRKLRPGVRSESKEGYFEPSPLSQGAPPSALTLVRRAACSALLDKPADGPENPPQDLALILLSEYDLPAVKTGFRSALKRDSVPRALETARVLLGGQEVRGVLIASVDRKEPEENVHTENAEGPRSSERNAAEHDGESTGSSPAEWACAILLKSLDQAQTDRDRIYAVIDGLALEPVHGKPGARPSREEIANSCKNALAVATVDPTQIGCLEISGQELEELSAAELQGLMEAYPTAEGVRTCGLGSVNANIALSAPASGLAGLIKTALCLYHRYIPTVPGWKGPRNAEAWEGSPFYVPADSRPWFLDSAGSRRLAAIHIPAPREVGHVILSEVAAKVPRKSRYLSIVSPYCIVLAGEDASEVLRELTLAGKALEIGSSLLRFAQENLAGFGQSSQARYAAVIVGHRREDLLREIAFMAKGLAGAFALGTDLKTPRGSFFTPKPLGESGKIAFVYPGVGSAYIGLGNGIFHLFPEIYDRFLAEISPEIGRILEERRLYPRTLETLTEDEIWKLELALRKDILSISASGTGFFALYTMILKDGFQVKPHCALGYSMGEPGMMAALGVWENPGVRADRFNSSPVFRERLSGDLAAVREYWNLGSSRSALGGKIWASYTLQTTPAAVRQAIESEEHVFLTILNAPDEVVIAGDPQSCLRVIRKIGCKHYPLGLDLAIHCDPVRLEYDRLVDLHTLPVLKNPGVKLYSSSCYKPVPVRSKAIAHSIAKAFCEPVDFPRLIEQVYHDGARIFIEVGSRKFCSNLIEKILKGKDHAVMATNIKGTQDQAAIARVLAKLVSHRVHVDLSPLLEPASKKGAAHACATTKG